MEEGGSGWKSAYLARLGLGEWMNDGSELTLDAVECMIVMYLIHS